MHYVVLEKSTMIYVLKGSSSPKRRNSETTINRRAQKLPSEAFLRHNRHLSMIRLSQKQGRLWISVSLRSVSCLLSESAF